MKELTSHHVGEFAVGCNHCSETEVFSAGNPIFLFFRNQHSESSIQSGRHGHGTPRCFVGKKNHKLMFFNNDHDHDHHHHHHFYWFTPLLLMLPKTTTTQITIIRITKDNQSVSCLKGLCS